jgi:aminoglycoside phosphotransferase (APT) family kinase protein
MRDLVLEMAQRHLPEARLVTRVFQDGFRHLAFEIDSSAVLKVARPGTLAIELEHEAALLHALGHANLPVPRLIAFDPGPPPFMLSTRIDGVQLSRFGQTWPEGLAASVARGLAAIHATPVDNATRRLLGELDVPQRWESGIARMRDEGLLGDAQAYYLNRMLDECWPRFSQTSLALTHSDFWPHHCFVTEAGELAGFIDLADATMAAPAWDLSFPWQTFFGVARDRLVEAYMAERALGSSFLEEVEFYSVFWALRMPQWAEERNLGFRGSRTALSVLQRHFARSDAPERRLF